nr:aminoacetone oxidase family FAD-binding enzyme [Flavobacteriales bacterium]
PPVPSLFTFNMPGEPVRELMGVVADPVRARIMGTELESKGPLLITHWGMSGPAVLRLSAWGARTVQLRGYRFTLQLHWLGGTGEEEVRGAMADADLQRKQAQNANPFSIPRRLWEFLLAKAGIPLERPWAEVGKKERNRLVDVLTNDRYTVSGKTTFKEEFVTAGGVSLDEVDPRTLQSLVVPGLYLAGEVLDIDGITGGFNFQAAWTTGALAGRLA